MYFAKTRSRFGWKTIQLHFSLNTPYNKVKSPSTANCINVSNNDTNEICKVDQRVSDLLLSTTIWRSDALYYISGYIVKKLLEFIECPECVTALHGHPESTCGFNNGHLSLLSCKKYGELIIPSRSVYRVVIVSIGRCVLPYAGGHPYHKKQMHTSCQMFYLKQGTTPFDHSEQCHILDQNLRDDHISIIIKGIIKKYLVIFYHQFGPVFIEKILKKN